MSATPGRAESFATTTRIREIDQTHFWFMVDNTAGESECWPWLGTVQNKGYGQFRVNGRMVVAHRISYELTKGTVPTGLELDHLCRNPGCVNPTHLEAVTRQVNILRSNGMAARHAVKTHCPQGHAYDLLNTKQYQGRRYCRACLRINSRNYRARKAVQS